MLKRAKVDTSGNGHVHDMNGDTHIHEVNGESLFGDDAVPVVDPLNWGKAAAAMQCSHLEEVKKMVGIFYDTKEVALEGVNLTVAHVAAVARRPAVKVVLDAAVAKDRVDESANWVAERMAKGTDIYGVTTGFGATSHRRTQQGEELQKELIRYVLHTYSLRSLPRRFACSAGSYVLHLLSGEIEEFVLGIFVKKF